MKDRNGLEFPIQYLRSVGSPLHLRHRTKEERIGEVLNDLELVIQGLNAKKGANLWHTTAALARACSIFLRKTVIDVSDDSGTRLLDDDFCQEADLGFDRLRRISGERKTLYASRVALGGSLMRVTGRGNTASEPDFTQFIPIGPQRLEISVEWPLPGMADWVAQPTKESPWELSFKELFELSSSPQLKCDDWLGQQLVMFDNRGITLKEVILVTVNSEGAHSSSISSLSVAQGEESHESPKFLKHIECHILRGITIYGVRYSHAIVIETALYLYLELSRRFSKSHSEGGTDIPTLFFTPKDVFSPNQKWLRFDGGFDLSFGGARQDILHSIRAPRPK